MKNALDYIRSNASQSLSLSNIATIIGFSPYHFARAFKATTGFSPCQYMLQCRVELAQQLLQDKERSRRDQRSCTLAEVAVEAGFGNQSHMTTVFRQVLQAILKQYRNNSQLTRDSIADEKFVKQPQ